MPITPERNRAKALAWYYNSPKGRASRPLTRRPNGEGTINWAGYRIVYVDGVRQREHRVIMAAHLGRPLSSGEVVHHIDEDKLNNDLRNLRLMTRAEHLALHR